MKKEISDEITERIIDLLKSNGLNNQQVEQILIDVQQKVAEIRMSQLF